MPSRRDFLERAGLLTLAGLHAPSLLAAAAPASASGPERPNLLLIMTDQQTAEAMSCRMGRRYLHTPAMDSLAAAGVVFTRAYSANPLCMPLRNSLFTGRYPHQTGVTQNAGPKGGLDPTAFPCQGTYFRNAGYETAYTGKWHLCFDAKKPDAHGFQVLPSPRVSGQDGGGGPDARAAQAAVEFLGRRHDRPFLLVVSLLNPHNICEYARRAAGREQVLTCGEVGDPPALDQLPPAPANLEPPRHEPDGMALLRRAYQVDTGPFPVAAFTADDWRRQRWGYYRMIEKVDAEIGRVLEALRQANLAQSTLVVFTSDHGECAGAHRFNQKTVFYEESVRVPLILSWPGRTPAGATAEGLVNTGIDILPTLLDVAGLDVPAPLPGRSLWPLACRRPVVTWRDHVVVQNHLAQAGVLDGFRPEMEGRMVRSERYKYCVYSRGRQRESLVDLQTDPGETNDLAADPGCRDVLLAHRELLARYGQEQGDPLVAALLADDVKPLPFVGPSPPSGGPPALVPPAEP